MYKLLISLLTVTCSWSHADLESYVNSHLPLVGSNVRRIHWQGQHYWIKVADPRKGWTSCWGRKLSSVIVPDKIIAPTDVCQNEILETEARRLRECEQRQGACARLILATKHYIVVSDAGISFETFIQNLPLEQRLAYLEKGLQAILDLHKHYLVQGRASIKDLTINENKAISFIDLAEDPEASMGFEEARTRDLIAYFMTSVKVLEGDEKLQNQYADLFNDSIPLELRPLFTRLMRKTAWLSTIAHFIEDWGGKDIKSFATAHRLLKPYFLN
ncbi:hypothetical protein [Candidatus Odyssella thessalonicensis]|uniref:hypothetical protein n=1 Tax=Candidatus Odyssella thessalonicensis TaxID=84647 RepID=UPI000225C1AF|nr:hypothetical protein [Candidatus Odyssella thessalonicensis]